MTRIQKHSFILTAILAALTILFVLYWLTSPPSVNDTAVKFNDLKGKSDTLVVMLHAFNGKPCDLNKVKGVIAGDKNYTNAHFLIPKLPFNTFSLENPTKIAHELIVEIDRLWDKHRYKHIVLVGHSMGALFARKLYVLAAGQKGGANFEKEFLDYSETYLKPREWAINVDRIILLAGMNNGWSISHHMGIIRVIEFEFGTALGQLLEWVHSTAPIIFSIRNGSEFITELRLQWISMKKHIADKCLGNKCVGDALTAQLLGTEDDLVPPSDNIDLVTGADFKYIEVPFSGHENVIKMDNSEKGKGRKDALLQALEIQKSNYVESEEVEVTDLVFVVHGIRDEGYWTEKIAKRVKDKGMEENRVFETIYSSYGYFPMLGFLRPGARDEKVQWFMNNYVVAKEKYPKAKFHFVGHSHGTYLLAKAIEKYDSITFDHILFAGSVVRTGYEWRKFVNQKRVKKLVNFTATSDWVVGWFPNTLEILHLQDLGSAGHYGFKDATEKDEILRNINYVVGGHSAAIDEKMWDYIANFIVSGKPLEIPNTLKSPTHSIFVKITSYVAPLIWILVITILSFGLYLLFKLDTREWKKTLYIVVYLSIIWTILTRV